MRDFTHAGAPLRLHHGAGSLGRLAADLDRTGLGRAVVVTGATLGAGGPLLDALHEALGPRLVAVHAGVRAHSPVSAVLETARALAGAGADAVIALGGGSAVVTARAAAIVLAEGGDLRALATTRDAEGRLHSPRLKAPKLPQYVVPTTPSTAMVKAGSAVFDPETGARLALFDPRTRAVSVALHPLALASAPVPLVLAASLNTLTLALEGVMSRSLDPLAEAGLLHALRLIGDALDGDNMDAEDTRAALAIAAVLAGRGTDHAGAGVAVVLGHALGARLGLDNGLLNVALLPAALRFNAAAAPGPITRIAGALRAAGPDAGALIVRLAGLLARHGVAPRLRDLGVPEDVLPQAARDGLADWFLAANPRPVTSAEDLKTVLRAAW